MTNAPVSFDKIQKGDAVEFERMFRLLYRRLCIYVENIIKSGDDSEDIVCNAFAHLWNMRGQINIATSVEAYMFACVYHEAINYLKHAAVEERYRKTLEYQLACGDLLNDGGTPLSEIIDRELRDALERAIGKLPPQCRKIFLLNKIDGLSYDEVAAEAGVSINTVRTQLMRATKKLRGELWRWRSSL